MVARIDEPNRGTQNGCARLSLSFVPIVPTLCSGLCIVALRCGGPAWFAGKNSASEKPRATWCMQSNVLHSYLPERCAGLHYCIVIVRLQDSDDVLHFKEFCQHELDMSQRRTCRISGIYRILDHDIFPISDTINTVPSCTCATNSFAAVDWVCLSVLNTMFMPRLQGDNGDLG